MATKNNAETPFVGGRTDRKLLSYDPYNKPLLIDDKVSGRRLEFAYGSNDQRFIQLKDLTGDYTVYIDKLFEAEGSAGDATRAEIIRGNGPSKIIAGPVMWVNLYSKGIVETGDSVQEIADTLVHEFYHTTSNGTADYNAYLARAALGSSNKYPNRTHEVNARAFSSRVVGNYCKMNER